MTDFLALFFDAVILILGMLLTMVSSWMSYPMAFLNE
jgi:hypothetical protein